MAQVVIMPKIGITVTECILTTWYKNVGDKVEVGDPLFAYETDKTAIDEVAETAGILLDRFYEEGDVVDVLVDVCVIGEEGESYERSAAPAEHAAPAEAAAPVEQTAAPAAAPTAASAPASGGAAVSPRAKTVGKRLGVEDFSGIMPTGPEGRIVAKDVENAAASGAVAPAAKAADPAMASTDILAYREEKLSTVRKAIARAMTASLTDIAQLTLNSSFDASGILALRKKCKDNEEFAGITLNDMVVHAVAKVLPAFPELNAHLVDGNMRYFENVNVGIAVDTERGLLVPAVTAAQNRSLLNISNEIKDLAEAAKSGKINPDLLNCGTFAISNLGTFGVESFTPVINPPQTGILGVDTITYRMRADGSSYPAMGLSLTFDHRAIDGAPAARFLQAVARYLENFELMQMK